MKAKDKLRIRLWGLFLLVVLAGPLSLYFMWKIANNAEVILEDNYNTLRYTQQMRTVLMENPLPLSEPALKKLQEEMVKEENNITEEGERQAVEKLRQQVDLLATPSASLSQMQLAAAEATKAIRDIEEMNLDAILRKHDQAQSAIRQATIYLALVGTLTFLILFSFLFNLPDLVETSMEQGKVSKRRNRQDFL